MGRILYVWHGTHYINDFSGEFNGWFSMPCFRHGPSLSKMNFMAQKTVMGRVLWRVTGRNREVEEKGLVSDRSRFDRHIQGGPVKRRVIGMMNAQRTSRHKVNIAEAKNSSQ